MFGKLQKTLRAFFISRFQLNKYVVLVGSIFVILQTESHYQAFKFGL